MESLAYLHLAVAYEEPARPLMAVSLPFHCLKRFPSVNRSLWLACVLSIAASSPAWAALKLGDRSADVQAMQQRLQQLGFLKATATGYFGPLTQQAVLNFQRSRGLTANGIVNTQTLRALQGQSRTPARATRPKVAPARSVSATAPNRVPETVPEKPVGAVLQQGDRGPGVRALQQNLRKIGFYQGPITSSFGALTDEAVRRFQTASQLTADGIVGQRTWAALLNQGGEATSPARSTPTRTSRARATRSVNLSTPAPSVLSLGQNNRAVAELQRQLRILGYFQGAMTGSFDRETQRALIEFQQDQGLRADGMARTQTLTRLQQESDRHHILILQQRLAAKGFYNGPLNGQMNPQLRTAISAAQRAYGVSQLN